jgi:signal transduction histidine kinase
MALTSAKKMIGDVHHQSPTPSKVNALKAKLHEAEQEVVELKEHVAQQDTDLNTYKTKVAALQADLTKCQISNAQLTSENRTTRNELDRLARNVKSFENEISDARRKKADSDKAVIDQKHSIDKATIVNQELHEKIAVTQRLVEKSVDIVHRFARELRPSVLDDLGLIPALLAYMKTYTEDTGVRVSLKAFADIELCDSDRRTALYRIVQEALTNVARHAKASRADVIIQNYEGIIRMEIMDDGHGFEVAGTSTAKKTNRLGLLGMRERVEMIGGTFCIESALGKSTTLRVEIPASNSDDMLQPDLNPCSTSFQCP